MKSGSLLVLSQLWLAQQAEKAVPAPAQAAPAASEAATQGVAQQVAQTPQGSMMSLLPMVLLLVVFMLMMTVPQRKRDKERRQMLAALGKGDSVVTTGGICGTIVNLSDTTVVLRVDDNTTIEFVRGAISQVTSRGGETKKK